MALYRSFFQTCFFYLLLGGFISNCLAQNEGNYWYFGQQAGLRFTGGAPMPLIDGQLSTDEGCTVMSNSSGNLLFYSDGIKVWNRLHTQMPNGFGLNGNPSSTHSAVAVPRPGMAGRYYLFTVDANAGNLGFCYSEIDISLGGGLGDVIPETKNKQLLVQVPEKVTAVKHPIENAYWVITHGWNDNRFYTYKITAAGVNEVPIISEVGSVHGGSISNAIGAMKISPNGKKVAVGVAVDKFVELFDFNGLTGQLSNPIYLDHSNAGFIYGVEFSPDNHYLYTNTNSSNYLFQFDLEAGSAQAIIDSRKQLGAPSTIIAGMQIAPDGRIYIAQSGSDFLGHINQPNEPGVGAGYQADAVFLAGRKSQLGLPVFIQSYFDECAGTSLRFFTLMRKTYTCPTCFNGKIAALGISGVPPYTYSIDGENFQPSGTFSGLSPGTYIITIKDATNCMVSRVVTLN